MRAAVYLLAFACAGMAHAETGPARLASPAGPLPDELAAQIAPVIAACWMPDALDGTPQPVVTLRIRLTREANVGEVSLAWAEPDTQDRVQRAYQSARRAVYRCAGELDLPDDSYEVWRDIEMTFDPTPEAGQ